MRKELFQKLKARLESMEAVKHVALWNHNVEFIEQEQPWERPAVFIELLPVEWRCVVPGHEYHSVVTVRLHIVYDWSEDEMNDFDLSSEIANAVIGLEGDSFSPLEPVGSSTNHNHEEIVEDIDTYSCECAMFID
jgi:hypothetical protein